MKRRKVPLISGDVVSHARSGPEELVSVAEMTGDAPKLDLHGMAVDQALAAMDVCFREEILAGTQVLHIVHGKGTGALHAAVLRALNKDKRVIYHRPALQGIGGAEYVVFSRS